jgi:hypothetical protein
MLREEAENFSRLKVPSLGALVHLVKVDLREGKSLGSEEVKS